MEAQMEIKRMMKNIEVVMNRISADEIEGE